MFQPFQKFINQAASKYGVTKEIEAAKVCQNFRTIMPKFFKSEAENFISPAFFQNQTLTINVENSAWAQEIIMRKPQIIHEMNKKAGKEVIKNLKTQLKTATETTELST